MKQILLKTWLIVMCLLVGAGTMWAEEVVYKTALFGSSYNSQSVSSYSNSWTATNNGFTVNLANWNNNNNDWSYIKAGNKNTAYVGTITTASAIDKAITKISVTIDAITAANVTSIKLYSGDAADACTIEIGSFDKSAGDKTVTISSPAANKFYKIAFDCIAKANGCVQVSKVQYYYDNAGGSTPDTRTAVNMTGFTADKTTLIKDETTNTSVTNDQSGWTPSYTYESNNTSVATVSNDGVITAVAKGTARITATLNIANDDENWKKGATASKSIDITVNNPSHNYTFISNNTTVSSGTCEEGAAISFPATDPSVDGVTFVGWTTAAIDGTQDDAPTMYKSATMGNSDVTYYAVFATEEEGGTQWKKVAASAVNSAGVYAIITTDGHAFNGTISSGHGQLTSTAFSFDANGVATSAPDGTCEITFAAVTGGYTMYNASNGYLYASAASSGKLAWHNTESSYWLYKSSNWLYNSNSAYLRDYQNSSIRTYGANNGSVIQFAKKESSTTYSDYCTTVALDPKPTIVLSATELAEYAGNTNTSITASVSEGAYTGALEVASSAEAVATASISEGTITINALTAGSATITVTAPAVTGFRKNTATIAVTVSEKLAHGLEFSADVLNLTVGDSEFSEPTLSNPNSLPVVYSLVYAKEENKDKVATINAETGKITLATLSTETQGAVTVKASTVGDNSHAAGEVTYNLVVARKVTTTSWSNEGAAVTIDKDEIATLPTASNDGERNIAYESSNEDVAKFVDGVLTFVGYGTTTITAKTSATAEYAATSATYELTFAPRYTVTFNINGKETVLREATTGAGVTAPTVEPIEGKVFRGWAEATIDGATDVAPAFVTTASLDGDKTLYAVFANVTPGAEGSVNFTISSISNLSTSNAQRTQTTDGITFTFSSVMDANVSGTHYVQMAKSSTLTQSDAFAGNIKSITFEGFGYSSASNASMLVEGKKGNGEYATVQSCGPSYTGAEISFGSNEYDFFKITIGSERTVKFTKMTVEYSGVTYSDYCTKIKATPTLSFAEPTYYATVGGSFDAPELTNPQEVSVTYSSSKEGVATVNATTGAITLVGAGTTTITATFTGNANYNATSASYELVVAPVFTSHTLTFKAQNDDGYYATFSSSEVTFFPEDVVVSAVGAENDALYLFSNDEAFEEDIVEIEGEEVTGYYVPANTGVLVYSTDESATYYTVTGVTPGDAATAVNMLAPCPNTGIFKAEADGNYYYKLAYGDNTNKKKLGFWWGANDGSGNFNVKAGGAVLVVPQSQAGSNLRGFSFDYEDTLTGLDALEIANDSVIYNIQGQRITRVQQGVNIVNGKKVIR